MSTIVANLKHAARNGETAKIGGGLFGPAELKDAAHRIECYPILLEALERLSLAALSRDITMGDPCRLIEVRAELAAANKQACAAITMANGG